MKRKVESVIGKDELHNLYITQQKSAGEIGKIYEFSSSAVYNLLKKYKIQIREKVVPKNLINKVQLYELYVTEDKNTYEIAEMFKISALSVQRLIKKYDIPKKKLINELLTKDELYELRYVQGMSTRKIAKLFNCGISHIANLVHMHSIPRRPLKNVLSKEKLNKLYIDEDRPIHEIAKIYGCRNYSISELLDTYGIYKETISVKLKRELTREKLLEIYTIQDLSMTEIAKLYSTFYGTIGRLLDYYKIERKKETLEDILTKDILSELYIDQGMTINEIGMEYDCSRASVGNLLKKYDIETRKINDYSDFGRSFERIVKEVFDVLCYDYIYHYLEFDGIIPDFYDKENDIILDAKLSSYTPFVNKRDFFENYTQRCKKVIIIYMRGQHVEYDDEFLWRHISYYYPELLTLNRQDLIDKVADLENKLSEISTTDKVGALI